MNLSAKSLFHFMQNFEYLMLALDGKFSPRYCKENIPPFFNEPIYIAMKCFCDIPLSLIEEHCKKYGSYGLGFKKEWGEKMGINPVLYYDEKSDFILNMKTAYNNLENSNINKLDKKSMEFNLLADANLLFRQTLLNYKLIKGNMDRKKKTYKNIYFYDEREWRYLSKYGPYFHNDFFIPQYISESDENSKKLEMFNYYISIIENLEFTYEDLNFIIVRTDNEIAKVFKHIDSIDASYIKKCIYKTKVIKISDIRDNI